MNEQWKNIVIRKIAVVVRVVAGTGKTIHTDRAYHGLVMNDESSAKDYCFSDGRVMRTKENELFYLPKGSSYKVKTVKNGDCYAINFDAELTDVPFSLGFRNTEAIKRAFKSTEKSYRGREDTRNIVAMRALYDIILLAEEELNREYIPDKKAELIEPAVKIMREKFCENQLTIADLVSECGISEAYFRRIFAEKYGISPKEYLINLRVEYAKQLLSSGQMSVSDTARACGYFEQSHFSREFSKRVGINPSEYKI